jgi:putative ABC transport system ATP-binding protein
VMELTARLVNRLGTTTLMVTHSLEQALHYGDRLVMLQAGAVLGDWSASQRQSFTPASLRELYASATVPVDESSLP